MKESISRAGSVIVDTVTITTATGFTQPVINQVAGIQLFEDIFSPFISGNIVFYDSLDLTSLFPFTGEETVHIKVHTPSFSGPNRVIDQTFYVYKLSDREIINHGTAVYRLHFISMEAIVDVNKKISQCFEGRCSDIVSDIVKKGYGLESKKQTNIESTPNGIKFISNYWSPVKNIKYIADRSVNVKNSPSFVFFENRNGLNFISLNALYSTPAIHEFDQNNQSREFLDNGTSVINIDSDYRNIRRISVPEGFDYLSGVQNGLYASKQISYDLVTKKYSVKNFDMLSDFSKNEHLNKFPITSKKVIRKNNSSIFITPKVYGNFNNFGDVTDSKVMQKRLSLMKQIEQYKVHIEVMGRTDYTVGQKVNLTLYKKQPIYNAESNKDLIDKVFSGNYIISAINHAISREEHICTMEIVKESLLINLDQGT